ncbi:flavin reductase family protein [Methylobacillus arboreus]|uniref:flavin reductase family protein n=1 Tax=Methylobacillus arboreus TaxID=755170 RepID=UPI001E43539B|nr:flavin reductase family protein [Methylobacillus arboreus]MCB5189124.1 flavin reductase family protein [Methylobacillus arboreus]
MQLNIQPVPLEKAFRLLNHGPTVLVTSSHQGHANIMAAAWNMPLDFNPSRVAIVVDKKTYTRELMEASGTFAINLPCRAQAELVVKVGSSSGRELLGKTPDNKFAAFDLPTFAASKTEAPLLEGCVAWLECKIISEPHIQETYDLFLAEVVAAYADNQVFSDGRWHFEEHDALRTLHHVAGGFFFTPGEGFTTKP